MNHSRILAFIQSKYFDTFVNTGGLPISASLQYKRKPVKTPITTLFLTKGLPRSPYNHSIYKNSYWQY